MDEKDYSLGAARPSGGLVSVSNSGGLASVSNFSSFSDGFFPRVLAAAGGLRRCSYDFRCLGVLWPFGCCCDQELSHYFQFSLTDVRVRVGVRLGLVALGGGSDGRTRSTTTTAMAPDAPLHSPGRSPNSPIMMDAIIVVLMPVCMCRSRNHGIDPGGEVGNPTAGGKQRGPERTNPTISSSTREAEDRPNDTSPRGD